MTVTVHVSDLIRWLECESLFLQYLWVISTVPALTPMTVAVVPLPLTVATELSEEVHSCS